jgi:radical SAM/Cys-rich protein
MIRFDQRLAEHGMDLRRGRLETLQINVGRKCNQACRHCHVDAGPWRTEMMDATTARRIGTWIERFRPSVVDLTGGAPELNENFKYLVETARRAGARVIDRNNLTIIELPKYADLPEYLAAWQVEIIASLPCYSAENVNRQRGNGVFERSIRALQKLNAAGYGSRLVLNLVYNPVGPTLPGPQAELEADYRNELLSNFGIVFNRLYTITNQPIARFAQDLRDQGRWNDYMELLANNFNPATVDGLMCRSTLSVGFQGELYDCDFNQMLGLASPAPALRLWDLDPAALEDLEIATGDHCLACAAGSGSSCGGAIA